MNSYTRSSSTTLLDLQRRRFDLLLNHPTNTVYHPNRLGQLLQQLSQTLAHWLTSGSMPKISKQIQGDAEVWRVYDPVINRTSYFLHEEDLRTWLEQRYYHQ